MSVLLFMAPWWVAPLVGFAGYVVGRYVGASLADRVVLMGRLDVRHSHAAGDSWRKWEDPIVYRRPWGPDLAVWALFALVGGLFAVVVR